MQIDEEAETGPWNRKQGRDPGQLGWIGVVGDGL